MTSLKEDSEVYANCIKELKIRLDITKKSYDKDLLDGVFYLEFMCLQFRKICELFAFSTLTANRQEYSRIRKDFEKDWSFSRIIKSVKKVNKKYFPAPIKKVPTQNGKIEFQGIKNDFLVIEDIENIYQECCDMVHAQNHYKDLEKFYPRNLQEFQPWKEKFIDWRERFIKLLDCHIIGVNRTELKRIFITYMHSEDVNANVEVITLN